MTQAFEISKITYRRKTHDKGIILGMRPWRWTLGAKYSPVFAKDAETGETLSVCSPQKSNFAVYIPTAHLDAGRTILIVNHAYQQPRIETTIRILEVNPQWIDAEVLECKEAPRPETRAAKRRKVVDYAPKTCETCVNEDDFVFGGRPAECDAPAEPEDGWTAAGIVASGCLEDADALNYDEYEMSELDVLMADVIDDAPNEEKEIYEENAENDAERAEIRRKASSVERALRNSRDAAAARNFEVISRTRTAGMRIKTYQLQTIKHRGDCSRIRRDKYAPPEIGDKIMTISVLWHTQDGAHQHFTLEANGKRADITVNADLGYVNVLCVNASSRRRGAGHGRTFWNGWQDALAAYKSTPMRAMIAYAQELSGVTMPADAPR